MNSTVERVGWVPEPAGRGTFGLIVSCATTIFLCTYSAVHPDVPRPGETRRLFWKNKMYFVFIWVFVPEMFVFIAVDTYVTAKNLQRNNLDTFPDTGYSWSVKHYLFAIMGGFVVEVGPTDRRVFQPLDLLRLIREKVVEMPTIKENDIEDRSKANYITKLISLIQVGCFLLQLLARFIQRLAVTALELNTLGIVVCGVVIYAYEWHAPFDVRRPVVLRAKIVEYSWPPEMEGRVDSRIDGGPSKFGRIHYCVFFATLLVFFACHLIGWNLDFPTAFDRWLWRMSSILCVLLPISSVVLLIGENTIWTQLFFFEWFLYCFIRTLLFLEIIRGLMTAPAGVYQTPRWSDYLPSFGA